MIITREVVTQKLLAYLNHDMTLAAFVDWAERTFIDDELEPDSDMEMLNDILMYLAAADTSQFPLTWEICSAFLERLGVTVQINIRPST
jgi:hypothetical protein